jgi:hypothetical protein
MSFGSAGKRNLHEDHVRRISKFDEINVQLLAKFKFYCILKLYKVVIIGRKSC